MVGWPRRFSGVSPGVSRCPGAALGESGVITPLMVPCCEYELLARFTEGSVYAQGYVDDICLLAVGKFPKAVSGLIQWVLHTVELWCLSGMRWVLFWVAGHAGIRGNEIARGSTALRFLGPEPALGVSRRDLRKSLGRWLANQDGAQWRGLGDTQRQAREFISGPSLGTRAKFMTFNRIQCRVVTLSYGS